MEITPTKTQAVIDMVLAEIQQSDQPLTSGDLYDRLHIEPTDTVVHTAIKNLLNDERIEVAGIVQWKRNTRAKAYRLTSDSTRLMRHLEADLGPVAEDLDTAASSHNGDEMHVIHAHIPCETAMTYADLATRHADPIIRALAQMDIREPRFIDGQMHIDRLRALASHLDEGKPVMPQMDLVSWLFDLAAEIEEMAE